MPTTLDMCTPGPLSPGSCELSFDPREQVVNVVVLQNPLAQRREDVCSLTPVCAAVDQRVPSGRQLLELVLVRGPLRLDRRTRALEPRLPDLGRRPARPHLANL